MEITKKRSAVSFILAAVLCFGAHPYVLNAEDSSDVSGEEMTEETEEPGTEEKIPETEPEVPEMTEEPAEPEEETETEENRGLQFIDGEFYYFDEETGEPVTGFYELAEDDITVYFDEETGKMLFGWQKIKDETYYFDPVTGERMRGFLYEEETDSTYYLDQESGTLHKGLTEIEGDTYFFNEDTGAMVLGFADTSAGKIYLNPENGHMLKGEQFIDDNWYAFDETTGTMKTGFVYIEELKMTVYYDPATGKMATGQKTVGDQTYYFNQDTGAISSGITREKDHTFYISEDTGEKLTGLVYDKDSWYCFDEETGDMIKGFHYIPQSKKTIYLDPKTGKMATGEVTIDGSVYHFDTKTGAMIDRTFKQLTGNTGKTIQVFYKNGRIVRRNFKYEQTYYQVNPETGEIIHKQPLFTDEIYWEGIDVSSHNGKLDLTDYQNGFVIIRASWGTNEDTLAQRNMDLCEQLQIPYGVYVYSYAVDEEQLLSEADFVLDVIKGRNPALDVWFDIEYDYYKESRIENWPNKEIITRYCDLFCDRIGKAGYKAGIYASEIWFDDYIDESLPYPKWIANWGPNDGKWNKNLKDRCVIHQYTSIPIDQNVFYTDPALFMAD